MLLREKYTIFNVNQFIFCFFFQIEKNEIEDERRNISLYKYLDGLHIYTGVKKEGTRDTGDRRL